MQRSRNQCRNEIWKQNQENKFNSESADWLWGTALFLVTVWVLPATFSNFPVQKFNVFSKEISFQKKEYDSKREERKGIFWRNFVRRSFGDWESAVAGNTNVAYQCTCTLLRTVLHWVWLVLIPSFTIFSAYYGSICCRCSSMIATTTLRFRAGRARSGISGTRRPRPPCRPRFLLLNTFPPSL